MYAVAKGYPCWGYGGCIVGARKAGVLVEARDLRGLFFLDTLVSHSFQY